MFPDALKWRRYRAENITMVGRPLLVDVFTRDLVRAVCIREQIPRGS